MSSGSTSPATRSTRDKVIRREFRLNEGDAFNALKVKRSAGPHPEPRLFPGEARDQADRRLGARPDRARRRTSRRSRPASSRCRAAIRASSGSSSSSRSSQNNFMGKGQELDAAINWSRYSKSVQLGFAEPYFLDKAILIGGQIYRRDYNSFNYTSTGSRNTTYSQLSTGGRLRIGFPVTEYRDLRRPLHAWSTTRSRSTRAPSTPIPTAPARCDRSAIRSRPAAICATKSAPA